MATPFAGILIDKFNSKKKWHFLGITIDELLLDYHIFKENQGSEVLEESNWKNEIVTFHYHEI